MTKKKINLEEDFCVQLIEYSRSRIIGNESQYLIQVLAGMTCFADDDGELVSFVLTGESGGGKTHVNKALVGEAKPDDADDDWNPKLPGLFPPSIVKHITAGSAKALTYSDDLSAKDSLIKFIACSELQKLEESHVEYFKSMSGDDAAFIYEVVDMTNGGGTKKITQPKRNYSVTFAQVNILDKELQTRLLQIPIEENRHINQCVVDLKFGADSVEYRGREYDFGSDCAIELHLQKRILSLSADDPIACKIPFPIALRGLVNIERPESKRHAQMIASLLKSSARLNYMDRKENKNGAVIVAAQDIVNVLSSYDILQSTMTGIDIIDLAIYNYLAGVGVDGEVDKSAYSRKPSQIARKVADLGLTELTQTELERRLKRLINENFVIRTERDKSGDFIYTVNGYKQMLTPTVEWSEVAKYDTSPVIDPLTKHVYDSIIEYGADLDRRKSSRALSRILEVEGDPKLTARRMDIAKALSGDMRFTDTQELMQFCTDKNGGNATLTGLDDTMVAISSMIDDGIIEVDKKNNFIRLVDTSLMKERKSKTQQTL